MEKYVRNTKSIPEIKHQENYNQCLKEHNMIKEKLAVVEKEEVFPLLVKLMRICKKSQISMPSEYLQYYMKTKTQLVAELRKLEKQVLISQINNENYSHLEGRITDISKKLGLSV